jgi:hypothetical protein
MRDQRVAFLRGTARRKRGSSDAIRSSDCASQMHCRPRPTYPTIRAAGKDATTRVTGDFESDIRLPDVPNQDSMVDTRPRVTFALATAPLFFKFQSRALHSMRISYIFSVLVLMARLAIDVGTSRLPH